MRTYIGGTKLKALNLLSAFFISVFLFIIVCIIIITTTLFNSNFMISIFEKNDYYNKAMDELKTELSYIAQPADVEPDVLLSVVNEQELENKIKHIVKSSYGGINYDLEEDKIESKYYENLSKFAVSQGLTVDGELKENLEHISGLSTNEYIKHVKFPFIDTIGSLSYSYNRILAIVIIVSMLVVFILICCLFIINVWKHRAIRSIIQAVLSTGFMLIAFPGVVLVSQKIERISITQESLYYFVIGYAESILKTFVIIGVLFLCAGTILFCTIYKKMYNKVAKK